MFWWDRVTSISGLRGALPAAVYARIWRYNKSNRRRILIGWCGGGGVQVTNSNHKKRGLEVGSSGFQVLHTAGVLPGKPVRLRGVTNGGVLGQGPSLTGVPCVPSLSWLRTSPYFLPCQLVCTCLPCKYTVVKTLDNYCHQVNHAAPSGTNTDPREDFYTPQHWHIEATNNEPVITSLNGVFLAEIRSVV